MGEKKNKIEQAVALNYNHQSGSAPKVVASGRGAVAEKILAAARRAGVDIVEDADLLEVLGKVPVGQEIPAPLFQAVAEILAFVYQANNRFAAQNRQD
ncbi:MAG: EscU/YscU/HrcU family type III secretion system export apparatus switch protein [Geopsychrobacter sp.]|nr:EscU/YscU/HrcU family type III secretion system export apparatus switch protein [Geopsychrobacter sp.]